MHKWILLAGFCIGVLGGWSHPCFADDLSDGISESTDENIAADDSIGSNKENNINFIVVDAMGKAKSAKGEKAGDAAAGKAGAKKVLSNVDDGENDKNENSIVVEPGSRVDKVYNIVIQK